MVGFLSAVGVNIVLGQLANFTGYQAQGSNRVVRAFDTLLHPAQLHLQTLTIGVTTIALILLLERTRLGALALVVAVIVASAATSALGWVDVAALNDLTVVPRSLPLPKPRCFGWLHSSWCPRCRWPSSDWCKGRGTGL